MSRIGKQPVAIPQGVTVTVADGVLAVKGPKGELTLPVKSNVRFRVEEHEVVLQPKDATELSRALWGTYRSHLSNMIQGVTEGFEKKLLLEGVGYRAEMQGQDLKLALGFSHPVVVKAEDGVTFSAEKNTITISGISKDVVGNVAATIRAMKKPEPYKGKGLRYENEVIRRKVGKKAAGTT